MSHFLQVADIPILFGVWKRSGKLNHHRLKAGGLNNGLKVLFRAKLG
jgi:hypothetical protein